MSVIKLQIAIVSETDPWTASPVPKIKSGRKLYKVYIHPYVILLNPCSCWQHLNAANNEPSNKESASGVDHYEKDSNCPLPPDRCAVCKCN